MHHVFRPLHLPPASHRLLNLSSSCLFQAAFPDPPTHLRLLISTRMSCVRQPVQLQGGCSQCSVTGLQRALCLQEVCRKKKWEERRRRSLQVGETGTRTGMCKVLGVLAQSEVYAQGAFPRKGGKEDSELKGAQVATRCSVQDIMGAQDCWTQE